MANYENIKSLLVKCVLKLNDTHKQSEEELVRRLKEIGISTLDKLCKLLILKKHTPEQLNFIKQSLCNFPGWKGQMHVMNNTALKKFASEVTVQVIKQDHILFKKGNLGEHAYMVLQGEMALFEDSENLEDHAESLSQNKNKKFEEATRHTHFEHLLADNGLPYWTTAG